MSLEQAIADNTAAVKALTEAILKVLGNVTTSTPPAATIPTSAKTEVKKSDAGATPVTPAPAPAPAATAPTPASSDAPALAYKDVAAVVNAYVAKFPVPEGREKALAKLATFGLKNATSATQDQWPAIIEAFKE